MLLRLKLGLALLVTATAPSLVLAQTFSGRLTSSFYAFERSETANLTSSHARGYQSFQFDYGTNNLIFHTFGQLDNDFNTRLAGDAKVRMYNFHLAWKNIARRAEIRLGRQPIFAGVAAGTIDGAQVKVRVTNWLRLKSFGGSLMPTNQRLKIIEDSGKNYMAGGQALIAPKSNLNISLSYFNKHQQRPGYEAERADSIGNVFTLFVEPSDRAYEYASVDASWEVKRTSLYGRSDYDLLGDQLTRAEFSVRSEVSSNLVLSGNYIFRSPRLPWNSIFSAFNVEDNHEVEGGIYYRYKPSLRFYGNLAGIFYSGDNSRRLTLGFDLNHAGLSFVRRCGYAGDLNGINASFYYPLRQGTVMPSAQLSWASYKLDTNETSRQSLFSGAAGLLVRPWEVLTIDSQLQYLHNRFYSNDVRFLVRLQYWFFTKLGVL
ncbi:MAG: hypothetical protein ONB44_19825 [candidate division KSB1 bacterium]|nr:hypothetical protein [candidate division KSB1 bacterium]MDZ7304379.1 hypothetical protein [candidate division KSB1 bacterium]MDZ7313528.1 hypothetical protein [candidate division KSB1 bacterium]